MRLRYLGTACWASDTQRAQAHARNENLFEPLLGRKHRMIPVKISSHGIYVANKQSRGPYHCKRNRLSLARADKHVYTYQNSNTIRECDSQMDTGGDTSDDDMPAVFSDIEITN